VRALVLALLCLTSGGCALFRGTPLEVEHAQGTLPTGVHWRDTLGGLGKKARPSSRVTIHYTAKLENGQPVDSSHDRGRPETFWLTAAPVLGWADGIPGMRQGGKRWLSVPSHRAFGDEGIEGMIPPGATLEFLIELLEVDPPAETEPAETAEE
jgi:FKBP-type peptidyl-prolyl cis-trans isomerase FkpA